MAAATRAARSLPRRGRRARAAAIIACAVAWSAACSETPGGHDADGGDADGGAGDLRLDRQMLEGGGDLFVIPDALPKSSDRCGGGPTIKLGIPAPVAKQTVSASTEGANNEFGDAIRCGEADGLDGPQRYYELQLEAGTMYRVTLAPQFDAVAYLASGCAANVINADCGSGGATGHNTGVVSAGAEGSLLFVPSASGRYQLAVDSRSPAARGTFELTVEAFGKPDQAECVSAAPLELVDGKLAVSGSTLGAPNEFAQGISCGLGVTFDGPQVYYAVALEQGQWYRLGLGADFAAGLYVVNSAGECKPANVEQDCGNITGTVLPPLVAGSQGAGSQGATLFSPPTSGIYLLAVDSLQPLAAGNFTLEVEQVTPAGNEICAGAAPLVLAGGSTEARGNTSGALNDRGAQVSCGGPPLTGPQAYYSIELVEGTSYLLTLTTPFDAVLAVGESCLTLPGDCLSSGLSGNAIAVAAGGSGTLNFAPLAAGTYVVTVEGLDVDAAGKFKLDIAEAVAPTNDSCAAPAPLQLGPGGAVLLGGDTGPLHNDLDAVDCGDAAGPWPGSQAYYQLAVEGGKTYVIELEPEPSFDAALYALAATTPCQAAAVNAACAGLSSDQPGGGVTETLTLAPAVDGTYLLVVDSWSKSEVGTFTLRVTTSPNP